jgi:hypothetical protein
MTHGWPGDVRGGLEVLGGKAPCGSTQLTEVKHGGYTGRSGGRRQSSGSTSGLRPNGGRVRPPYFFIVGRGGMD